MSVGLTVYCRISDCVGTESYVQSSYKNLGQTLKASRTLEQTTPHHTATPPTHQRRRRKLLGRPCFSNSPFAFRRYLFAIHSPQHQSSQRNPQSFNLHPLRLVLDQSFDQMSYSPSPTTFLHLRKEDEDGSLQSLGVWRHRTSIGAMGKECWEVVLSAQKS